MSYIIQFIKAFLDGFFPIVGFLILLGSGWYLYVKNADDLAKLPLIQELTDTYKIGWKETLRLGSEVSTHIIMIQEGNASLSPKKAYPSAKLEQKNGFFVQNYNFPVEVSWKGRAIEEKLLAQGWSARKIKAAYAYLTYIDRYMDDAIKDMYATGVSASITIAQGILESNAGRSGLTAKTNNHFGIKARPNKKGRKKIKAKLFTQLTDDDFKYSSPAIGVSQHYDDHKYDRFEVYASVLDSYKRHSRLLQNSCTVARKGCYAWIWQEFPVQEAALDISEMAQVFKNISGYAPKDFFGKTLLPYYAAQAAGLKMAGYATSKTYHKKLVYLIETYELWRLDIALIRAAQKNKTAD